MDLLPARPPPVQPGPAHPPTMCEGGSISSRAGTIVALAPPQSSSFLIIRKASYIAL